MAERIKLLMAISDFSGGGGEREFAVLAHRLDRARFDAHLCLHRSVYAYPAPSDLPITILGRTRPWHVFRTIRRTARLIDELKPDLVFSQLQYVNMITGAALHLTRHKPKWIPREVNDPVRMMGNPLYRAWARWTHPTADMVMAVSRGVAGSVRDYLRVDESKIEVVTNCVEVATIQRLMNEPLPIERPPGRFVIVNVGRLAAQKNQSLLLRAFARVKRDAELWILGQGPLRASLEAEAASLGIQDRVRWFGFHANPYPLIRSADCLVLSSDHEGLPSVIIEAMVCRTPVIATRCRFGPDELIADGVTGRLVEVGDAAGLATAIEQFAGNPEAARAMAEAAHDPAVALYDAAPVCRRYEELFTQVVHGRAT